MPRIVSFLPAGTEIACALGAGAELVGRSHECDYPPEVTQLPVVSRPALALEGRPPEEVDRAVAERLRGGESLYEIDEPLLRDLAPDVILTQDLCQVCAPSGNELTRAVRDLPGSPRIIWLSPRNLFEIEQNILAVGEATGRIPEARALIERNRERIAKVRRSVSNVQVRQAVVLEWVDPLFAAGHWVPEMVSHAGGRELLGKVGEQSVRVTLDAVLAAGPELAIFAPCGFGLDRAVELGAQLPEIPGAEVIAVDANAYFARPGPRVAEGIELLAHLFHPEQFQWPQASHPWQELPKGGQREGASEKER